MRNRIAARARTRARKQERLENTIVNKKTQDDMKDDFWILLNLNKIVKKSMMPEKKNLILDFLFFLKLIKMIYYFQKYSRMYILESVLIFLRHIRNANSE